MEKAIGIEHPILKDIKKIMIKYLGMLLILLQSDSLDLDMDKLFENVKWIEIPEVTEKVVYETEKITATAGVRGNEAEHEILNHLYYVQNSKMGFKSPKPFKIDIIR